jgi:ribosome recycling factor
MQGAGNVKDVMSEMKQKMDKSVQVVQREFSNLRTGRASTHLVENIMVSYYNTPTPLKQLATISTTDAKTIAIAPWDGSNIKAIESAIQKSDLNLTPVNDGKVVRVQLPPLTSERRLELVKVAKQIAEDGRVSARGARHEAIEKVKKLEKDKVISEDESRKAQKDVQTATDEHVKKVDELLTVKEKEITEI